MEPPEVSTQRGEAARNMTKRLAGTPTYVPRLDVGAPRRRRSLRSIPLGVWLVILVVWIGLAVGAAKENKANSLGRAFVQAKEFAIVWDSPSLSGAQSGSIMDGSRVRLICKTQGSVVRTQAGGDTTLWYRISDENPWPVEGYLSEASLLRTGSTGAVPECK